LIDPAEVEVHRGQAKGETTLYPDKASAKVAADEFHARVRAIAEEMGVHSVFAVADFYVQPTPAMKPDDKSLQAVVLFGCARCMGYEVARCTAAAFEIASKFFEGFTAGATERLAKALANVAMVDKSEKARQKGYDA
jgi:hypothetical protein